MNKQKDLIENQLNTLYMERSKLSKIVMSLHNDFQETMERQALNGFQPFSSEGKRLESIFDKHNYLHEMQIVMDETIKVLEDIIKV